VWEGVAVLALAGLLRLGRRVNLPLISAMLLFIVASAFFSLNAFLAVGISAGVGWYALSMSAAEATLLACGFAGLFGIGRARPAMACAVAMAVAFDLYTAHFVLAPYYAGLIRHRANGSLEAFHWTGMAPVPRIWALYLLANAVLVIAAAKSKPRGVRRVT